jgi:hypothetical protein
VSTLRPLSESECYTRLYGERVPTVAVLRESEPDRPEGGLLGEEVRRTFEERFGIERDEIRKPRAA